MILIFPTLWANNIEYIYDKIEESDEFTITGYEVKFSKTDEHDEFSIYLLDKDILTEAMKKVTLAFISEEKFNEYMNGAQGSLEDVKIVYQNLGFKENIVIKENFVSTKEKIYEDSDELAQDLLFGFNHQDKRYTVKSGDTIESISEKNTLNVQEFLIANPKFTSEDSLLAIGETVNVTLIDPEISFVYSVNEIKEQEVDYETKIVRDTTRDSNFSEITTAGVTGLKLQYSNYTVTNGEMGSDVNIYREDVIREKVDQITTKGKRASSGGGAAYGSTVTVDTGTGWKWPTINPYMITSVFGYRWGRLHNGIDIGGPKMGTNIFAASDGVVVAVNKSCPDDGGSTLSNTCGGGLGNYVVIQHDNNIYTQYGHMTSDIPVKVGQTVARGKVIGHMGNSGRTTGRHLHFGASRGFPGRGGSYFDPRSLYK